MIAYRFRACQSPKEHFIILPDTLTLAEAVDDVRFLWYHALKWQ